MSVAEKYDVPRRTEFNTMCLKMVWDTVRSKWTCTFKNELTGETFTREADIVVSAVGTLDRPSVPEIEGKETFKGNAFHSARWDSSVDVKDKNVVVLGNGASATQFVPRLASLVGASGSVTQIVRSAHWWTKRVCFSEIHMTERHELTLDRAIRSAPRPLVQSWNTSPSPLGSTALFWPTNSRRPSTLST